MDVTSDIEEPGEDQELNDTASRESLTPWQRKIEENWEENEARLVSCLPTCVRVFTGSHFSQGITLGIAQNLLDEEEWSDILSELPSKLTYWKWRYNFKEFAVDILFFLSTLYDVVSDSLVAEQFFTGAYYSKTVKYRNDTVLHPIIENSTVVYPRECTPTGETVYINYLRNQTTQAEIDYEQAEKSALYHYECYQDSSSFISSISPNDHSGTDKSLVC